MAKYILFFLSLTAFAADKPDLLAQMDAMTKFFAAHKPVDVDQVMPKFPEAMHLLAYATDAKSIDKQKRVHAIVLLAASTIPFDHDENTAADVLAEDYARKDLTPLYEKELAALPDEAVRNRLSIGLHELSDHFKNGSD